MHRDVVPSQRALLDMISKPLSFRSESLTGAYTRRMAADVETKVCCVQSDGLDVIAGERDGVGPQFLVHNHADTVGVIVVEDVRKGQSLTGLVMDTDDTITLKALDDIPLGHKIALKNIKNDETVVKYGHDIGRAVAPITPGRHVHVHNVKTKRW